VAAGSLSPRLDHDRRMGACPLSQIDYQDLYYYSIRSEETIGSLDEVDPEISRPIEKLGIPLREVEVLEGVVRQDGEKGLASAASRSMPCLIPFQSRLTFAREGL